jgi:Skp family chaperone for outer membrane proteins
VTQINYVQRKLEQERKALNSQVHGLERKLDVLKQELVMAVEEQFKRTRRFERNERGFATFYL